MTRFYAKMLQNKKSHFEHEQLALQLFSGNKVNINYGYQEPDLTKVTKSESYQVQKWGWKN